MGNRKIKIELELKVSDEDCENLIADALYACHYWCDEIKTYRGDEEINFSEELINDEDVRFMWNDRERDISFVMTRMTLVDGIAKAIREGYQCVYVKTDGKNIQLDFDKIDAIGTDVIIQMAVFNHVKYG